MCTRLLPSPRPSQMARTPNRKKRRIVVREIPDDQAGISVPHLSVSFDKEIAVWLRVNTRTPDCDLS